MVKQIGTDEYNAIMENKSGNYVIDFFATWCGPCKMLAPIMEELSDEIQDVTFCKIDIDKDAEPALINRVTGVPTVLFIQDGRVVAKTVGYSPKEEMQEWIEENK